MKKIIRYFDKLEDRVRNKLSRRPIIYAFIGGLGMVIFWRAAWEVADMLYLGDTLSSMINEAIFLYNTKGFLIFLFYPPVSLIWVILLLLVTGLFVSFFIGDRIIISGVKHEKKLEEKTEEEIAREESEIQALTKNVQDLSKEIQEIKDAVVKK